MLQLVTVPIAIGLTQPEILGTLSVGFLLDNALAAQLKEITGSDVAFGMDGQILAATLPRERTRRSLALLLHQRTMSHDCGIGGEDYVVLPRPLAADGDAAVAGLRSGGADSAVAHRATSPVCGPFTPGSR